MKLVKSMVANSVWNKDPSNSIDAIVIVNPSMFKMHNGLEFAIIICYLFVYVDHTTSGYFEIMPVVVEDIDVRQYSILMLLQSGKMNALSF